MTKEQMKHDTDKHIASTKGVVRSKSKGHREKAWADVIALEMIMKATKGE